MEGLLRVRDDRGDSLVAVVLFCCGDSYEDDLRWEPRLGVSVDLVELDDVANGGVTLFKTIEALRETFFSQLTGFIPIWKTWKTWKLV